MFSIQTCRQVGLFGLALLCANAPLSAQVHVLMQHNDIGRTGANLQETSLNNQTVAAGKFHKLCFRLVDGNPYAQPLYTSGLRDKNGATHNVVFVATEHNKVYAFDADNISAGDHAATLWETPEGALGKPIASAQLAADIGASFCVDLTTEIGITSTPTIDLPNNRMFVVAKSKDTKYAYTIYVLDIRDGSILKRQDIQHAGPPAFDPKMQLNRPGLLLLDGTLYVAFGGHCDRDPFKGWLFAYAADTLSKLDAYATTPNGTEAGIWQSGQGLSADGDGNVYVVTGNGTYRDNHGTLTDSGDAVLKLKLVKNKLTVVNWFSPLNRDELDKHDADLGSAGAVLLPNSNVLVAGGKEGKLYLIDRQNMGKSTGSFVDSVIATRPPATVAPEPNDIRDKIRYWNIHGSPVIWDGPIGRVLFVCGEEDPLKAFLLQPTAGPGWKFASSSPLAMSTQTPGRPNGRPRTDAELTDPNLRVWMPGAFLSLSADGNKDGTGLVWATMPLGANANQAVVEGVLRVFDAAQFFHRPDGSQQIKQLWSSDSAFQDGLGMHAKFCPPIVANGKVFVTTFNEETVMGHAVLPGGRHAALAIYGLTQ